ncbi:hypothetical protein VTK73DRAFT_4717 [Phialemonium thermophilum]|uniref:RNA-dependent RNA polymerase n=1 Tax=Phialemonium thermophilum TaxID=223376 RepID=A0ABR3WS95_9PEZI
MESSSNISPPPSSAHVEQLSQFRPVLAARHLRPGQRSRKNVPAVQQNVLLADWSHFRSLLITLKMVPRIVSTWDIWRSLCPFGTIVYVEIDEDQRGERTGLVRVRFEPPPASTFWAKGGCQLEINGSSVWVGVQAITPTALEGGVRSPLKNPVPAKVVVYPAALRFGILTEPTTFMGMHAIHSTAAKPELCLSVDFKRRKLTVHFLVRFRDLRQSNSEVFESQYKLNVKFQSLKLFHKTQAEGSRQAVIMTLDSPPQFWRKKVNVERSHAGDRLTWAEQDLWARAVDISYDHAKSKSLAASLANEHQLIDMGRWTTYWVEMEGKALKDWAIVEQAIADWNIKTKTEHTFRLIPPEKPQLWSLLDGPRAASEPLTATASDLLARPGHISLPFDIRYQLEVCISHDVLNEHNVSAEFLAQLAALTPLTSCGLSKARCILEYAADRGKRIFNPMALLQDKAALSFLPTTLDIPHYCALVRKVTVTPTRIYFNTPTVETTNRVVRHFREVQENFLRVQFVDELHEGRINGSDTLQDNEIYTRVFRILNNGIRMGRWHWQFLAFGNSQIRENGAFFFCEADGEPAQAVTCEKIRQWMGKLNHIKVIAKYAARLGQCFSTTRLLRAIASPNVVRIPDIEHRGYCFTDGVGKISAVLARMIAEDWGLNDAPSAYQFRMGGCKGLLVSWPDVSGLEVHIRKSQEKFHAEFNGLEIIRCSQFSIATLNRQTITILSSLGVPDHVFTDMLTQQLQNYDKAITAADAAVSLLTQYVDESQVSVALATMVLNGFMETSEPFVMSLLQLWRAWSIKALKEKARLVVEDGAFVLGCVDETGTLRGYDGKERRRTDKSTESLPQIFLQVPDARCGGRYKVITGLCAVGRNPSLHPGDIRVVEAVDVPALRHLRDVVVFPSQGSRDVPSMCSGGDLDGDDFFVFWDPKLLPQEWFYRPMDYIAPPPKEMDRNPTVQDLKMFFALYMKNNSLPVIAHSHLAQADFMDSGPKDPRCIQLARSHSQAVDYVKTGIEAVMDRKLAPRRWPHFMEKRGKPTYHSSKVLGQLYDKIGVVDFNPSYERPFDSRILTRYKLPNATLKKARQIKSQYDAALRRVMGQMEIKTEFEIWSSFVLSRPRVGTQYKLHETVRRESEALKQQYRDICIKEAGGSRDFEVLGPFVSAMYQITWEEVQIAIHESRFFQVRPDGTVGRRPLKPHSMPLLSFPWLFDTVLGRLATGADIAPHKTHKLSFMVTPLRPKSAATVKHSTPADLKTVSEMDYARTSDGKVIHRGEILRLFDSDDESAVTYDSDGSRDSSTDSELQTADARGATYMAQKSSNAGGGPGPDAISDADQISSGNAHKVKANGIGISQSLSASSIHLPGVLTLLDIDDRFGPMGVEQGVPEEDCYEGRDLIDLSACDILFQHCNN